ncbi:unnamed protein product [Linum tenue]|uniref:Uncharacterized protein n=1 Tax=Linum tenue TaxID=586396 RepID=A0AAV0NQ94_9ROSI|nr:unnamed protein product [Linum tenue]
MGVSRLSVLETHGTESSYLHLKYTGLASHRHIESGSSSTKAQQITLS